jgi:hypothetical protein
LNATIEENFPNLTKVPGLGIIVPKIERYLFLVLSLYSLKFKKKAILSLTSPYHYIPKRMKLMNKF